MRVLTGIRTVALVLSLALTLGCERFFGTAELRPLAVDELELGGLQPGQLTVPNVLTSIKFAVIGDSGRGSKPQKELAEVMTRVREQFRFDFVVMLGDNIYEGPASANDYRVKFEEPYARLLKDGVDFYAVLGNHDDKNEVNYEPFHMKGERYYTFAPPSDLIEKISNRLEFFALDTTNPDTAQLAWLDERLAKSDATWKICLSHHPLYTTGRYRNTALIYRHLLEPMLVRHGVDTVFSGHEHIYQRSRLQRGVQYFVSGGAGSIRPGEGTLSPLIARTFADDLHFMLIEVDGDKLHFQAMTRKGLTIDAGVLKKEKVDSELTHPDTAARR